jgi:hypothetical protein
MLEKYGHEYNSQRSDIKEILSEKTSKRYMSDEVFEKLNDKEWLYREYVKKKRSALNISMELGVWYDTVIKYCRKHGFEIRTQSEQKFKNFNTFEKLNNKEWLYQEYVIKNRSGINIASELSTSSDVVLDYCRKYGFEIKQSYNISTIEVEILSFIKNELGFYSASSRNDLLEGKLEIDIFIPERNIGIEVNGLYWHSDSKGKTQYYHSKKTEIAKKAGIRLIHITDHQWNNKQTIVKSMIRNMLGKTQNKIFARKCELDQNISFYEQKDFTEQNHIQGSPPSVSVSFGLRYNKEIVSLMTFGVPRFDKNAEWELLRFCNKLEYSIPGAFSKLLTHFIKKYNPKSIISYADKQRSIGNVYIKNGFKLINKSKPGYIWTNGKEIFSRYQTQKKYLKNKLNIFDEKLSEAENMYQNGYFRYWDCGQLVFLYTP